MQLSKGLPVFGETNAIDGAKLTNLLVQETAWHRPVC